MTSKQTTRRNELTQSATNRTRRQRAAEALIETLLTAHEAGFFGTASVEVTINDGTIQHIRRRLERMDKL